MSFQQMRDYIHVFVTLDNDLDGWITVDNFRKCFSHVMSNRQIDELFFDKSLLDFRKIEINEFLEIVKPKECILNKELLKSQVKDYLAQLMRERKNDMIDRGVQIGNQSLKINKQDV